MSGGSQEINPKFHSSAAASFFFWRGGGVCGGVEGKSFLLLVRKYAFTAFLLIKFWLKGIKIYFIKDKSFKFYMLLKD